MCGIAGAVTAAAPDERTLRRMSEAIAHRGPDSQGRWQAPGVSLLHRRLSILDLEAGQQPMESADGRFVVCFNGEIYNYPQLRRHLEARGRRFRTHCDTEVLLHLYDERGPDMLKPLRGMFAFALWDVGRRCLFLARDPLGQKPLFYWQSGGELVFGSEIKAILASERVTPELDLDALWHHTSFRFCPGDITLFAGIRKLPPGHCVLFDPSAGTMPVARYWDLDPGGKQALSWSEAVDGLHMLLDSTVQGHLLSDVPVGAFLSGGVDSSLVAALARRQTRDPLQTFSIGVTDSDFSELPYARSAAATLGTDHHEFQVEADLLLLLPDIVWHMEEPSDPHAVGLYLLSQHTRKHVKVVVGGDGGDEVFGGYTRYTDSPLIRAYNALPELLRRHLTAPLLARLPESYSYFSLASQARWVHETSLLAGAARHYAKMTFFRFSDQQRARLFTDAAQQRLENPDSIRWIAAHYDRGENVHPIDRMLYAEQMTRLPEHYLLITDRMSMAHGLESRVPLVDAQVVEYAASLPTHYKIKGSELKRVLRRVAGRYFTPEFLNRRKQGFGFPMARWFRDELGGFIHRALADSLLVQEGLFDPDYVQTLLREHQSGRRDHNFRLWSLLNLEVWFRLFIRADTRDAVRHWIRALLAETTAATAA